MRFILFIGCLLFLQSGYAQSLPQDYAFSNVGMTFLSVSTDARSGGMGDLGVATLPDAYSHQQNAAKYLFLDSGHKGGINLFYVPWLRELVNDMSIAGASAIRSMGRAFAAGEFHRIHWKTGLEYNFHELLYGRLGYCHEGKSGLQRRYLTFGAGIRFMRIHLDAAYLVSRSRHSTRWTTVSGCLPGSLSDRRRKTRF